MLLRLGLGLQAIILAAFGGNGGGSPSGSMDFSEADNSALIVLLEDI